MLFFSLALLAILRLVGSPGFCFTLRDLPRIVWSIANAMVAAQAMAAAAARNFEKLRMSSPPSRWGRPMTVARQSQPRSLRARPLSREMGLFSHLTAARGRGRL